MQKRRKAKEENEMMRKKLDKKSNKETRKEIKKNKKLQIYPAK